MKITENKPLRWVGKASEVQEGDVFRTEYPNTSSPMYLRIKGGVVNLTNYSYCSMTLFSDEVDFVVLNTELHVLGVKRHA